MSSARTTLVGLARCEFLLGWRSPAYLAGLALCAVVAALSCASKGTTASLAGFVVSQQAASLMGFVALMWMSHTGCRDVGLQAEEMVLAKPQSQEVLLLGRFAGNFALVLLLALGGLAAGAVTQVTWGGTPFILSAYGHALARSITPLLYLSVLGYSLCALFGTPIAGGVVALYWILILSGRDYVSRIFNFSLSQNSPVYLLLSVGVLALAILLFRPDRRGEIRWPRWLVLTSAASLAVGLVLAILFVRGQHDPPLHRSEYILSIGGQYLQRDRRIPGFWLPSTEAPRVGLYPYEGNILVVGLWSPAVPESVVALELLRRVHDQFAKQGVVVFAICVSEDHAIARHFDRENGYPFLMLHDPGARQTDPPSDGSPAAEAYDASSLPKIVVADRDRIVRYIETMTTEIERSGVPQAVRDLVASQPYEPLRQAGEKAR